MSWIRAGWIVAWVVLVGVRLWNGLTGPLLRGYDDHGHVGYVLFLDLYRAIPWADQGWSYFHPPLHYVFGWVLAQLGSAEALLHGLALVNGVWSLAIAWLAASLVARVHPDREDLSLFVFASLGALPVYLYTSTMAGNELTAALFGTLAFVVFLKNENNTSPTLGGDVLCGALLGLALLSKVSAVLVLGAVGLSLGLRLLRAESLARALPRVVTRGAILAGLAVVVASPYYVRNVVEFGTPFKMSRDNPHVVRLESIQAPGSRTWLDFVSIPLGLFEDPNPRSEHLLHSVWGSAYAQTWADSRLSWENLPDEVQPKIQRARTVMVTLGIAPTLLVLLGALLAAIDIVRGRRQATYVPVFALAAVSLVSFSYFAIAAPQYSALKASYLLGLTLPFGLFLARGVEGLGGATRSPVLATVARGAVLVPALAAALVHADGVVLPRLGDHPAVASARFYFGDLAAATRFYREQRRQMFVKGGTWNDELATVALASGDPFEGRSLFELRLPRKNREPFRWNALAVATALGGDLALARDRLDRSIEAGAAEVGLTNRGVVLAAMGGLAEAEASLKEALELDASLAPAWQALAQVLERAGKGAAASDARARGARAVDATPRGHPYGIPDGLGQYPSVSLGLRFLLRLDDEGLAIARAPFRADLDIATRDAGELLAEHPHVVLIVVDTLRADHLGAYGYPRDTSPRVDQLAREGVRFANVFAPSSWTLPSVASVFTSKTPEMHKANSWGRKLDLADTTFVERLAAAGYETLGVSGNFVHVSEKTRFDQGFDAWHTLSYELDDSSVEALLEQKGVRLREPTGREINATIFDSLPEPGPRPLFLYVHYMEPHSAYDPPDDKRVAFASGPEAGARTDPVTSAFLGELVRGEKTLTKPERQRLIDLYDAEIATVDQAIGELLDELEARGFGDKLVVGVAADHGEAFGEHESWFHGLDLHWESLSVPFIVWDSRTPRAAVVDDSPSDLLDVPTTLLALAGVDRMPGMLGRNLLGDGPRFERPLMASLGRDKLFEGYLRPRSHRRAATHWPWKILVDASWVPRLYNLEEDPEEKRPVALFDARVSSDLRKKATLLAKRPTPPKPKGKLKAGKKKGGPTDRELEQLRALGYAK